MSRTCSSPRASSRPEASPSTTAEYDTDSTKIFAYLTIPEDAKLGVSAHELGHLLFGFPDLSDIDGTSEGIGSWCLMAAGSWNGGRDTPAHPSAWCKANQGWVSVENVSAAGSVDVPAVKESRKVDRLWTGWAPGPEYFLLENRQREGFDADLPGDGLLMWHIDDNQSNNTDESHYLVGLLQADGALDLEHGTNRGDAGDVFLGGSDNRKLDATTVPATTAYSGQDSSVAVLDISDSAPTMTASVRVGAAGGDDTGDDLAVRLGRAEERINRLKDWDVVTLDVERAESVAGKPTCAPPAPTRRYRSGSGGRCSEKPMSAGGSTAGPG